jgi:hypothetical protein
LIPYTSSHRYFNEINKQTEKRAQKRRFLAALIVTVVLDGIRHLSKNDFRAAAKQQNNWIRIT